MMSYEELLRAWKVEKASEELSELPEDFYRKAAELMAEMRAGLKMLDRGTLRARLARKELANAEKMLVDIFWIRMDKALKVLRAGGALEVEKLTPEERALIEPFEASFSELRKFIEALLRGELRSPSPGAPELGGERPGGEGTAGPGPKRLLVRFIADVPALVGADMKVHGPFRRGDVAFIPTENALALIRKGMAVEVELP